MKKQPLISIVIPSYNHARFIAQALSSIYEQNYRPLEVIVVDDGSTDDSHAVITKHIRNERGLTTRYYRRKNQGAPSTINFGLDHARGEYLTILNSDDFYHPDRLATLVRATQRTSSRLLFTTADIVDVDGNHLPATHSFRFWYDSRLSVRHCLPTLGYSFIKDNIALTTGNLFFPRSHWKAVGKFRDFKGHHDLDFILRSVLLTEPLMINMKLMSYRVHSGNTISSLTTERYFDGKRIFGDYLSSIMSNPNPVNKLAPCPAYWPAYFHSFLKREAPFFSTSRIFDDLDLSRPIANRLKKNPDPALLMETLGPLLGLSGAPNARLFQASRRLMYQNPAFLPVIARPRFRAEVSFTGAPKQAAGANWVLPGRVKAKLGDLSSERLMIALLFEKRIVAITTLEPVGGDRLEFTAFLESKDVPLNATDLKPIFLYGQNEHSTARLRSGNLTPLTLYVEPLTQQPTLLKGLGLQIPIRHISTEAYIADAADGHVDVLKVDEHYLRIQGWSLDRANGRDRNALLVFQNGQGLPIIPLEMDRQDLSSMHGVGAHRASRAGYAIDIPKSLLSKNNSTIHVISVLEDGTASVSAAFTLEFTGSGLVAREISRDGRQTPPVKKRGLLLSTSDRAWKIKRLKQIAHRPMTLKGFLDGFRIQGNQLAIAGWSFDPEKDRTPSAISVFSGGRCLMMLPINRERPDLVKVFKSKEASVCGFSGKIPLGHVRGKKIQVYAHWEDNTAIELITNHTNWV